MPEDEDFGEWGAPSEWYSPERAFRLEQLEERCRQASGELDRLYNPVQGLKFKASITLDQYMGISYALSLTREIISIYKQMDSVHPSGHSEQSAANANLAMKKYHSLMKIKEAFTSSVSKRVVLGDIDSMSTTGRGF